MVKVLNLLIWSVFLCRPPQDKLKALVFASQSFKEQPGEMEALWDSCSSALFSLEDKQKQLGLGSKVGPRERGPRSALHVEGDF